MKNAGYFLVGVLILSAACTPPSGEESLQSGETTTVYVQSAKRGALSGSSLTLEAVSVQTAFWALGRERFAGQIPTRQFVQEWAGGESPLAATPVSAQLTCTSDGRAIAHTLNLEAPILDGDDLVYSASLPTPTGKGAPLEPLNCESDTNVFIEAVATRQAMDALPKYDCFRAGMCSVLGSEIPKNIYAQATLTSSRCSGLESSAELWQAGRRWAWFLAPKRRSCMRNDALRYYCATY